MANKFRLTRRRTLALAAATAALPLVHIRTAGAAGKLTVGFWDHWVPPANDVMRKQVQAWAETNKVDDVTIDFITSNGNKIQHHPGGRKRRPAPVTTCCRSPIGKSTPTPTSWNRSTTSCRP